MSQETIKSSCRACHGGCGVMVTVRDNKVINIKGRRAITGKEVRI